MSQYKPQSEHEDLLHAKSVHEKALSIINEKLKKIQDKEIV